jgi:ABC-2 type transport system ATP-binding protein
VTEAGDGTPERSGRPPAVSVRGLVKRYDDVEAVSGIDFDVPAGETFGFLGPNGAGKSTTIGMLCTLVRPSDGRASVAGHDVVTERDEVRRNIGLVFQDTTLDGYLTAEQNLRLHAELYGVPREVIAPRMRQVLEMVGLWERRAGRVNTFSGGMKRRLEIARGFLHSPRVLFLDEPTIGMDPMAARDFRQLVRELRGEGRTILLTTHDMAEAEALCDRVALIDHGKLLAVETPAGLARRVARHERIDFEGASELLLGKLRDHTGVAAVRPSEHGHRIELADADAHRGVLALLFESGVTSLRTSRPSLEEVYLHLIGDRGLEV